MSGQAAIENRWRMLFAAAWQTILQSDSLMRLPPKVKIEFSRRIDASECARIEWSRNIRLVISSKFASDLDQELTRLAPTLSGLAFASPEARKTRRLEVVAAVGDIAVTFVLLHELFHLMGGHLNWMSKPSGIAQFDEQRLGLAFGQYPSPGSRERASRSSLSTSYVLESEADSNAIQWLIQFTELDPLCRLLRAKNLAVMDWAPQKRQPAFRLVLAAVWLIIRKLESSRSTWPELQGKTHPLPVTRLFIAFGTLLQEYSVISDIEYDEAGGGQHRPSGGDVPSIREFLWLVMGPVLKADWSPGGETVPPNSLEGQMVFYFPDFANHMLNREVTPAVGRQIIHMERARFRMDRTLKPYRFFPAAQLRRRSSKASSP